MRIIRYVEEMREAAAAHRGRGRRIGFVPTMGALHEGHLSLVRAVGGACDLRVISIFVNPAQFGPAEDFNAYPRPFEEDAAKAGACGCDILFAPLPAEMYPEPYHTYVTVEEITAGLCGASRPGHFRGVATVVLKLLNIVGPHCAAFGQKDAQQLIVIRRMVEDLNLGVAIIAVPTVREADGLAMSSRNAYLTAAERAAAPALYRGLAAARAAYEGGARASGELKELVRGELGRSPLLLPEYVEVADIRTLAPVPAVASTALLALACRTAESRTRLIDNIVLGGTL